MAQAITLNICHLYPDLMDTYGDKGNIIAIVKRCHWRGIETKVSSVSIGDKLNMNDHDIYFFGGGQDRQQIIAGKDLQKKSIDLKTAISDGAVMLSICGGYQLLQNYFKTLDGEMIKGIGLFDAHTIGSTTRMIQNLLIEMNSDLSVSVSKNYPSSKTQHSSANLVGFENHSGKTFLGSGVKPLGKVLKGSGNNGGDQTEGAVYENAFGCYLHGSLLPKNPHFADYLIKKALERRYGEIKLKAIDDSFEWQAHRSAITRTLR